MRNTIFTAAGMTLVAVMLSMAVPAQERSAELYNSIPDSLKKEVYFEGFDGSNGPWKRMYGDSNSVKTDGAFLLLANAGNQDLAGAGSPPLNLDEGRDFEIEFLVMTEPPDDVAEIRFGWGEDGARIEFDMKPALCEFQVIRLTAGIEYISEPSRNFIAINRTDHNRICIRKLKDKFYFFANKALLLECRYRDMPLMNLFAGLSGKGTARFDFVRISYLNVK